MSAIYGGSCGVTENSGAFFKSKKALKDAAKSGAAFKVRVFDIGNENVFVMNGDCPNQDGTFYVAGPDAQNDRRWYAEITVRSGKVTIK